MIKISKRWKRQRFWSWPWTFWRWFENNKGQVGIASMRNTRIRCFRVNFKHVILIQSQVRWSWKLNLIPLFSWCSGYWTNHSNQESLSNYRAGFNDCASRVCNFMENQPTMDSKLREQILVRLAASCSPVKSDSVYCPSSGPAVYGLQAESPFCCGISSPPPSPTSSAFSPFNPNNGAVTPSEAGTTCSKYQTDLHRSTAKSRESTCSPVECQPLWRPWISSSENGKI